MEIEDKIRKRTSYAFWQEVLSLIRKKDKKFILNEIYKLLDDKKFLGSMTYANYHRTSLDLVLKDNKLDKKEGD